MDDYVEKWEKEVLEPILKARPERRDKFTNLSDTEIERIYLPDPNFDFKEKLGTLILILKKNWVCRGYFLLRGAFIQPCIVGGFGPSVNSLGSARQ
ncbi:MAG: hypothetical protein ACTSSI_17500 [Candidatus Helarchaeota archaeon]